MAYFFRWFGGFVADCWDLLASFDTGLGFSFADLFLFLFLVDAIIMFVHLLMRIRLGKGDE